MFSRPIPETGAPVAAPVASVVASVVAPRPADCTEKPIAKRLKEVVELLGKLTGELGIPLESPEVQELKGHLDAYVRDGLCWSGKISFEAWDNRVAHVVLPKSATKPIEVVLKKAYVFKRKPPV